MKIIFQCYLALILQIIELEYKVKEVMPTEDITSKFDKGIEILDLFKDFQFSTLTGEIVILEFKKNKITQEDLDQCYEYYHQISCKYKCPVIVIIIGLSDDEPCRELKLDSVMFIPIIILTKKINKQKELNIIRNKIVNNIKLSRIEAALLVTLPIFDIDVSEAEMTREACLYIYQHEDLIPEDMCECMRIAMYLNIKEFINDEREQEKLKKMIKVTEALEGTFAQIGIENKEKWMNEAKNDGIREVYTDLLQNITLDQLSEFTGKKQSEILDILNSK